MKGICLRFYMSELQKHHGMLMYEWLLECAKKQGIPGGSVFRAMAGYGRHGVMRQEHFFELASEVPVEVDFIVNREEAGKLLKVLKEEKVNLFYALFDAEFGTT